MSNPKELLIEVLRAKDAGRSRSVQTQVGPSEIGGCRRKVWYRLNAQPQTNDNELKLAAIMGTAIHASIEEAIQDIDPKGEKYWVETEVEYNGMKAHVDLFIPETGDVVDWKTSKLKNLSYFPSKQQRWQVQVYGYLLEKSGKAKVTNVNLVAIARDGDERDVKIHSEPYDETIALEAMAWLDGVKASAELPEAEKDESYCKFYCKYYDASGQMGCTGLKKERIVLDEQIIEDDEVDKNALLYLQLDQQVKEIEKQKESLKTTFEGLIGTTKSGAQISWSTVAGRKSVDTDAVQAQLGEVPYKQGLESIRLLIKQTGGK